MRNLHHKLAVARGEQPAELLFKNGKLVNVLSGEIHDANIAVEDGRIIGLGDYKGRKTIDLRGAYIAPSLIDGHFHVESSQLTAPEFARAVVPHGTGAVVIDPHEYANVLGLDGIRYVLESSKNLPLDFFIMLPSCVPATALETAGARITADDLGLMIADERVAGIAELMNYPGVYLGAKKRAGQNRGGQGQSGGWPRARLAREKSQRLRPGRGAVRSRIDRAGGGAGKIAAGPAHLAAGGKHGAKSGRPAAADQSAQLGQLLLRHR